MHRAGPVPSGRRGGLEPVGDYPLRHGLRRATLFPFLASPSSPDRGKSVKGRGSCEEKKLLVLPRALPLGELSPQVTERARMLTVSNGYLPLIRHFVPPTPPFVAVRHLLPTLSPAVTFLPGAGRIYPRPGEICPLGGRLLTKPPGHCSLKTERAAVPCGTAALWCSNDQ